MLKTRLAAISIIFVSSFAFAKGASITGTHAFTFGLGLTGANQSDMDTLIGTHNTTYGGTTASTLGSAWELFAQYQFRITGTMFALLIRPSYFTQSSSGSGCAGECKYDLSGYTLFPMFRMYPLENNFLGLFMQVGVGYGNLSGKITEGPNTLAFSGGNFGASLGLGVDFCFTTTHCMSVEGTARYLPVPRNVASSASGTITGTTQATGNQEVEIANTDFSTTMSGIMGSIAYTMAF